MDVRHLSTTLISGWALCPTRAWDAYALRNERGDDQLSSDPTRFGNVVHDTCEEAHNRQMRGEPIGDPLDLFDHFWRQRDCYDFDYYQLGRDILGPFLDRTIYERQGATIATELHFLLDLVTGRATLLDGLEREDIEGVVELIILGGGIPVMSKIDRVDRDGDIVYIFDYKTNAQPFTRDEIEKSIQLGIYHMAAAAIYPWAKEIVCVYDMVRHGRFPHVFPADTLATQRAYLVNLWHQIHGSPEALPRRNQYCNWCHLRANCPVYLETLTDTIPEILTEEYDDAEGLAYLFEQWEDLGNRQKAIESRREEIGKMLSAVVVQTNGPVHIGDREIYLSPNPRSEYPADKVFALFQEKKALVMLRDVMTIQKGKMDRALRSIPFAKEVEALLVRGFNRSSLKARSLKPIAVEED